MQVDQGISDIMAPTVEVLAQVVQPTLRKEARMRRHQILAAKKCEESTSQSKQSEDDPMDGGTRQEREREREREGVS